MSDKSLDKIYETIGGLRNEPGELLSYLKELLACREPDELLAVLAATHELPDCHSIRMHLAAQLALILSASGGRKEIYGCLYGLI